MYSKILEKWYILLSASKGKDVNAKNPVIRSIKQKNIPKIKRDLSNFKAFFISQGNFGRYIFLLNLNQQTKETIKFIKEQIITFFSVNIWNKDKTSQFRTTIAKNIIKNIIIFWKIEQIKKVDIKFKNNTKTTMKLYKS